MIAHDDQVKCYSRSRHRVPMSKSFGRFHCKVSGMMCTETQTLTSNTSELNNSVRLRNPPVPSPYTVKETLRYFKLFHKAIWWAAPINQPFLHKIRIGSVHPTVRPNNNFPKTILHLFWEPRNSSLLKFCVNLVRVVVSPILVNLLKTAMIEVWVLCVNCVLPRLVWFTNTKYICKRDGLLVSFSGASGERAEKINK